MSRETAAVTFNVRRPTKRELNFNSSLTEVKCFAAATPPKPIKRELSDEIKQEFDDDMDEPDSKTLKICDNTQF